MTTLSEIESIVRIVLALVAGGIIGYERERSNKSAGLRTYALVCEGAALFMIGSLLLGETAREHGATQYDPSRVASTIVQGIGFLAAGLIFVAGDKVRGLTTAAAIWVTAAIGLLIGAGFFVVALTGTVTTLLVLVSLRWVEERFVAPGSRDAISNDEQPD